jgi:hypothetical protein
MLTPRQPGADGQAEASKESDGPSGLGGLFAALAGEATRVVLEPLAQLAGSARAEADRMARVANAEVDRVERRARSAVLVAGACVIAVALLAVGLAGAVGDWLGRPWAGQLVSGATVMAAALGWAWWRSRSAASEKAARKRAKAAGGDDAPKEGALPSAVRPSLPGLLLVAAAGWLAAKAVAGKDDD